MVTSVGAATSRPAVATTASAPAPARHFAGRRVGFYSYSYRDVINTYGMSRSLYGSINSYRDPFVDRQTRRAPSTTGSSSTPASLPRGGDSPYLR